MSLRGIKRLDYLLQETIASAKQVKELMDKTPLPEEQDVPLMMDEIAAALQDFRERISQQDS